MTQHRTLKCDQCGLTNTGPAEGAWGLVGIGPNLPSWWVKIDEARPIALGPHDMLPHDWHVCSWACLVEFVNERATECTYLGCEKRGPHKKHRLHGDRRDSA